MRKVSCLLIALALFGFGCGKPPATPAFEGTPYENQKYGFAFDYPAKTMDIWLHEQYPDDKPYTYLGLEVDFIGALRDIVVSPDPENIIYMYAAPNLTIDDFVQRINDGNVMGDVSSRDTQKIHGIKVTKLTSPTDAGDEKHHFLFESGGSTIILSEFLTKEKDFAPVLQTLRPVQ